MVSSLPYGKKLSFPYLFIISREHT